MKTRSLSAEASSRAIEHARHAEHRGVIGGAMKVTRAELSHFIEFRLQAFVAEELTPTLEGKIAELVQPIVAELVEQILVARGVIEDPKLEPSRLVSLAGEPL